MQLFANKLSIHRGNRLILSDISFTLSTGEALVLTGPNGAGKTTLIRAIAGFLPLTSGCSPLYQGKHSIEAVRTRPSTTSFGFTDCAMG